LRFLILINFEGLNTLFMKGYFLLLAFFFTLSAGAQTVDNGSSYFVGYFNADGKSMVPAKKDNLEGSPFLNDNWELGKVYFASGKVADKMLLQFDLYKNQLQFRQDTTSYYFAEPVKEFIITAKDKEAIRQVLFRNGYIKNSGHATTAFYNVMAEGKNFQLLKMFVCRLQDKYEYIGTSKQIYQTVEELYLYEVATKKFIRIKKDRNTLAEKLGTYNEDVKKWLQKHSIETEAALLDFTDQLNK
jgi:hypothetical protein